MTIGSGHTEIETLLGAYALDAVDPDERAAVERHLAECPRCRAELDAHREMAGALGNTVVPPPADLWDRIAGRLGEASRRPGAPAMPDLGSGSTPDGAPIVDLGAAGKQRSEGWRPSRAVRWGAAALAGAAVVLVAVLGINLSRVDNQLNQVQRAIGPQVSQSVINAALAGPHRLARLTTPTGARAAEFVIVPDGRGFMVSSAMAPLPASETYQLWGAIAGKPISLGLLGRHPTQAAFTVAGSTPPTQLMVTIEPAGGVAAPDRTPIASGRVVTA